MTVSGVSRISAWLLSVFILIAALAPMALGATIVNATFPQPDSGLSNGGKTLTVIWCLQDRICVGSCTLSVVYPSEIECQWLDAGSFGLTTPEIVLTGDYRDLITSSECNILMLPDGNLISSYAVSVNYYPSTNKTWIHFTSTSYWGSGDHYLICNGVSLTYRASTESSLSEPFINWGSAPIPTRFIRSHLEQPFADEQNYYYIECTEDNTFLYWFSIYQAQILVNNNTLITGTVGTDPVSINGLSTADVVKLWKLNIHTENNTTRLVWLFDPNFDPYSQLDYNFVYQLSCAKYDLVTGELVSLNNFTGDHQNISSFEVLYSGFELPQDLISIRCYGVSWYNNSRFLINLASIIWGVDPVVEQWRSSVYDVLEDIRDAIVGEDQEVETVTVPVYVDEVQAAEETLYNGMAAITDQSGDSILHGGGGRLFDSLDFGEGILTPLQFFRDFYDDFIEPHSEIVFLLTFLLIASVIVAFLGKHIKL